MSLILGHTIGYDVTKKQYYIEKSIGDRNYFINVSDLLTEIGKRLEKQRIEQEFQFKYDEIRIKMIYN